MSGGASASFVYDGDGNRVKATFDSSTIAYVGDYFEWKGSTSTMVKYYYANGQRIAMRVGSTTSSTATSWPCGPGKHDTTLSLTHMGL